jgi:hypothetical protein
VAVTIEYALLLRALGQYLDSQQARRAEIAVRDNGLSVSWSATRELGQRDEQQHFDEFDLEVLRMRGKLYREAFVATGDRAELLRTLGQELDREHINLRTLVEDDDGYWLHGTLDGAPVHRPYTMEQLRNLSAERRITRTDASV